MKKITKQTYLDWYENMLFWRKFEDKLAAVYIQQKGARFFTSSTMGRKLFWQDRFTQWKLVKDRMITAYRNHVQPIGMGVDPKRVMAELYGKATGTSQGLGWFHAYFFKRTQISRRSRNCRRSNSL